ncbi:hypothetical protein FF2_008946 [Malus domestica]
MASSLGMARQEDYLQHNGFMNNASTDMPQHYYSSTQKPSSGTDSSQYDLLQTALFLSVASTTPNLGRRRSLLLQAHYRPPSMTPNLGRTKDEGGHRRRPGYGDGSAKEGGASMDWGV